MWITLVKDSLISWYKMEIGGVKDKSQSLIAVKR